MLTNAIFCTVQYDQGNVKFSSTECTGRRVNYCTRVKAERNYPLGYTTLENVKERLKLLEKKMP